MPNSRLLVGNPYGGISKQPPTQRFNNQLTNSLNVMHRVRDGATKRPGTDIIALLTGFDAMGEYRVYPIDRDEVEKYLVVYGEQSLRVFQIDGTECTVTISPEADSYLFGGAPPPTSDDWSLITQADTTIIANRKIIMRTAVSPDFVVTGEVADYDALPADPTEGACYLANDASASGRPPGYYCFSAREDRFYAGSSTDLESNADDGTPTERFSIVANGSVTAMDVDSDGNVVVGYDQAGANALRVEKFSPEGQLLWSYSLPGVAEAGRINFLRIDRENGDDIYCCSTVNADIKSQYGTKGNFFALKTDGLPKWGTDELDTVPFGLAEVPNQDECFFVQFPMNNAVGATLWVTGEHDGLANNTVLAWGFSKSDGSQFDSLVRAGAADALVRTIAFENNDRGAVIAADHPTNAGETRVYGLFDRAAQADRDLLFTAYDALNDFGPLDVDSTYMATGPDGSGNNIVNMDARGVAPGVVTSVIGTGNQIIRRLVRDGIYMWAATDNDDVGGIDIYKYLWSGRDITTQEEAYSLGITGSRGVALDDFAQNQDADNNGWVHVPPPNDPNAAFVPTTMPVKMVRTDVNPCAFEVSVIDWSEKKSGTESTNPTPPIFTDNRTIADIAFSRGRFWILSDDTLMASQSNDVFNFFPTDFKNIVDSDPIELFIPSARVSIGEYLTPYRKTLVIHTKSGEQYEVNTPDLLGPDTAALQFSTSYDAARNIQPVTLGAQLYFASREFGGGTVWEYLFDDFRVSNLANEVTSHVPGLLPEELKTLSPSSNNNSISVLTQGQDEVWQYVMFWGGNEKVQSSWSRWVSANHGRTIDVATIDTTMFALEEDLDGNFLLTSQELTPITPKTLMPFSIHLDREQELLGVFDGTHTTWTLGRDDVSINAVVLGPGFLDSAGQSLTVDRPTLDTIRSEGDFSLANAFVGKTFDFEMELSRPFRRDQSDAPILDGKLQLFALITNHFDTVNYGVSAFTEGKDQTRTRVLKEAFELTGQPLLKTGEMRVSTLVNADNSTVKITDTSPWPVVITSMEWLADFVQRN